MSQKGKASLTHEDGPKIAQFLSDLSTEELLRVANKLGLRYSTLKEMSRNSLPNGIVHAWLRKDEEPSWKSLQKALMSCGYQNIVSDIKMWRSMSPNVDADEEHVKFLSAGYPLEQCIHAAKQFETLKDAWEYLEQESDGTVDGCTSYESTLPPLVCPRLKHRIVDRDLHQLSHHMLGWDVELSPHLCLSEKDISDIKQKCAKPEKQRREALIKWMRRQLQCATYGNLLQVFADAGQSQCAEALCALIMKKYYTEEIVQAAKKNLKIERKHAHSMFIDPGESGKSSLMHRLLGRRKQISTSTGVAEPVIVADIYSAMVYDSDIWEEVKFDESLVGQMHEESQSSQPETNDATTPSREDKVAKTVPKINFGDTIVPINDDLKEIISSTVKRYGGEKGFENFVKNKFSIYMRDAGGQVEFQQLVSLLVYGPSIFIFVFRADLDLENKFEVGYRRSGNDRINCYTSSITLEEALLQSLASVYAMSNSSNKTTENKVSDIKTHDPYVIIVATHKDQLGPSADVKIKELNKNLHFLITSNGFDGLVQYADNKEGQVAFAVDNTSESDNDFKPIRKKIHNLIVGRNEFSINYPMSYLLFSLELKHDKRNILSLAECEVMAAKYEIKGEQVIRLLNFLHLRLGVIQFINIEGVRPIIMKKPEDLYNKVTELAVRTFPPCDALTTREYSEFDKKGILPTSAFENAMSTKEFCTSQELIKILKHLHIITLISSSVKEKEERYFIPCVLNHVQEPTQEDYKESDVMPLAIRFHCKHCPKGVFGVLITYLMADDSTFQLIKEKIFKDQISLDVNFPGVRDEISLKLYSSHIEVKFFTEKMSNTERETSLSQVCSSIRNKIEESIYKSIEDNRDNVAPQMCFKCIFCSGLHPVQRCKLHCREKNIVSPIPDTGKYWFSEDCSTLCSMGASKTSCLLHSKHHFWIAKYLTPLGNKELVDVGLRLGIYYATLQKKGPDSLLNDMVHAWLRRDDDVIEVSGEPSWESLVKALEDCGHSGIASDIKKKEVDAVADACPSPKRLKLQSN